MALKDTVHHMKALLHGVIQDLEKSSEGNKAASQRVRTATIRLEKVAKTFRKESILSERGGSKKSKSKATAGKRASRPAHKKAARKKK